MNAETARDLLRRHKIRVTQPRIAVLIALENATRPLACTEVIERLRDESWDPATIYRNLLKLTEVGLTTVVSRVDGVAHYQLSISHEEAPSTHQHPHFVCDDCGEIACLPSSLTDSLTLEGPWSLAVKQAQIQLRGECPECIDKPT